MFDVECIAWSIVYEVRFREVSRLEVLVEVTRVTFWILSEFFVLVLSFVFICRVRVVYRVF